LVILLANRCDGVALFLRLPDRIPFRSFALRVLPVLFFASGATSLVFQTIFSRLLTYTFGNTAYATSTVLAAFLGGLSLGAFLFGRWVDRRKPSLIIYGTIELLVAVFCFFIPQFFSLLTQAYVSLQHRFEFAPSGLVAVRFALAAVVILIPTILMGGTLPAIARFVAAARGENYESDVSKLYGWNTLGAAAGTLASTYLLMPTWGVRGTLLIACGVNLGIFASVMVLARFGKEGVQRSRRSVIVSATDDSPRPRAFVVVLVAGAFVSGAAALAYEVLWTHVLAFLIGNTVYAFGVMLFTILAGLGIGAQIVARRFRNPARWTAALVGSQLFLAITVFTTLPLWDRVPDVFAGGLLRALELDLLAIVPLVLVRAVYAAAKIYRRPLGERFPWPRAAELTLEVAFIGLFMTGDSTPLWKYDATYFVVAEFLRFICAFYLMIVPAILLGLTFPLMLNLASRGQARAGSSVGGIYAANTLGAIAGATLAGFVLLPHWGSFASLRSAASLNLLLGLAFAFFLLKLRPSHKMLLAAVAAALLVVSWSGPSNWDAKRISRGSYVYFNEGWRVDRLLYFAEDVQSGLTTVIETGGARVMLSNGKFQGNNSGEVGAQVRFALIPLLFTRAYDRALVIGLGTGHTLKTLAKFPFRRLDTVEIAPKIVDAARLHFQDVNGAVFDRDSRVRLTIADGRNYLLLAREPYDLITIEISSIWISGAADLYNKEFYELCRGRMKDDGVLQQWVQIHHMRTEDLLVVLNTAAQVFPHVAFFQGPEQGLLIASKSPLGMDVRELREFDSRPDVQGELRAINVPSSISLLGELMLYGDSMRRAVAELPRRTGRAADFASTDLNPFLEYQTPRGNVLPQSTVFDNLNFMLALRPADPLSEIDLLNVLSEDELNLLRGYVATQRADLRGSIEYLKKVNGPLRSRAEEEIKLIESGQRRPKLIGFD
jgi:spermidine synthase